MNYPTLYKLNTQGTKWLVWNISVTNVSDALCVITRRHGTEDGKHTESVKEVKSGKNKGRTNETTVYQQACLEASSMWKKQIETNKYAETKTVAEAHPSPMLAHSYDKQAKKIKFPCFVQPKLDGVRMISKVADTGVICLSRTGKAFDATPMQFIAAELQELVRRRPDLRECYFDGELFSPDLMFEDIVGACRTSVEHDETKFKQLNYCVYDIIPPSSHKHLTFQERIEVLRAAVSGFDNLKLVDATQISAPEEVATMHDLYVSQNFEGVMIRNTSGVYESKRSYNLQKYKNFVDQEYEIVDVKEAVGNDAGTAILQCKMDNDCCFWVRPRGSREYRAKLLKDPGLMGKHLTVRYQNLTDKGIPRFPVGVAIRDYE